MRIFNWCMFDASSQYWLNLLILSSKINFIYIYIYKLHKRVILIIRLINSYVISKIVYNMQLYLK